MPAFIFFFQMLYPFAWVNRLDRTTAAAAGGCMLVRRDALAAAGGIEAIRGALIDDCALARSLKPQGPIRLALTQRARSIRGYATVQDIRRMVARSAYAQLGYSPLLLTATAAGMALVYRCRPSWRCSATALRRCSASSPGRSWQSLSSRSCGFTACRPYGDLFCRRSR